MNKRNDFICIGAVHSDYILQIKENYYKNRTNPINQYKKLGGVAYNIAKKLSFLNQKTKLYSLNCNKEQRSEIKKRGINFVSIDNNINERYYTTVIDKNGKMILGLANMDKYEKNINPKVFNNFINKKIILDLNLSPKTINHIINKFSKKNYLCICGTSAHKVYKIKNFLKNIDAIILNKQESLILSNKKTIKDAMNYIIKKNNKLNIIITNGKYAVNLFSNNIIYTALPPKTNIKNENGAGDAFSAVYNYFFCNYNDETNSLKYAISAGTLQAAGYKNNKEKYLQKINKLSKSIKIKKYNQYE